MDELFHSWIGTVLSVKTDFALEGSHVVEEYRSPRRKRDRCTICPPRFGAMVWGEGCQDHTEKPRPWHAPRSLLSVQVGIP